MDIPSKLNISDYEFRLVIGRTKIDYDLDKEEQNRKKHSYSLESAVHLLERIILPLNTPPPHITSDPFIENDEIRHMHMSVDDDGKVVFMVTTMRQGEIVRVISFRRAHKNERTQFYKLTGYQEMQDQGLQK